MELLWYVQACDDCLPITLSMVKAVYFYDAHMIQHNIQPVIQHNIQSSHQLLMQTWHSMIVCRQYGTIMDQWRSNIVTFSYQTRCQITLSNNVHLLEKYNFICFLIILFYPTVILSLISGFSKIGIIEPKPLYLQLIHSYCRNNHLW